MLRKRQLFVDKIWDKIECGFKLLGYAVVFSGICLIVLFFVALATGKIL